MNHITLIETFMNLVFIGWMLFIGFIGGNLIVEYIEDKAEQAAKKRDEQNKKDGAK